MRLKRIVLTASALLLVAFAGLYYYFSTCNHGVVGFCWQYRRIAGHVLENSLIVIPLFLFSAITYKLNDQIFQSWIRFAAFGVPLAIILPLFSSTQSSGGFSGLYSPMRMMLQYLLPVLFSIISLGIIFQKGATLNKRSSIKK
jgi:hypothetical protein